MKVPKTLASASREHRLVRLVRLKSPDKTSRHPLLVQVLMRIFRRLAKLIFRRLAKLDMGDQHLPNSFQLRLGVLFVLVITGLLVMLKTRHSASNAENLCHVATALV